MDRAEPSDNGLRLIAGNAAWRRLEILITPDGGGALVQVKPGEAT